MEKTKWISKMTDEELEGEKLLMLERKIGLKSNDKGYQRIMGRLRSIQLEQGIRKYKNLGE